jgi:hypothetical protein
MALTAKFVADFSSFYEATQKAEVSLKGFDAQANKVNASVNRMADQFSGRKLIQEATLMAAAIEKIGGASNLTEKELAQVSAKAADAVAKMRQIGEKVPADLQNLANQAKPLASTFDTMKSAVMGAAGALGIAFGGQAIVNAIKDQIGAALAYADQLSNLSASTSISVQGLQRLESIGVTSGVSMQTLAGAVETLQRKLDDPAARVAVRNMGLDYAYIRSLAPENQFLELAKAISKIEDPVARANAGSALFGKQWSAIAPALKQDVDTVIKATKTMSDEQVAALDAAGDEWDKWKLATSRSIRGFMGDLVAADKKFQESQFIWNQKPAPLAIPTLPGNPLLHHVITSGTTTVDPSAISSLLTEGRTLEENTAKAKEKIKTDEKAATASAKYADAVTESLDRIRVTEMNMGAAAVRASQNVAGFNIRMSETVAINRDFSKELTASTVHTDHFGHVVATNVEPSLRGYRTQVDAATTDTRAWDDSLDALAGAFAEIGQASGGALGTIARDVGTVVTAMHAAEVAGKGMKAGFTKGGAEGYASLATGALGAVGAIDAATNSGNKAISVMGGMAAGAKAGMAFGPYGAAIGAAAGAITGFVKANQVEGKTVSPLRDAFFEMAGGLEVLNPQVEKLTGNLTLVQAVFDAKTVDEYNAALANLQGLFKQEQDALATLTETADRYGLTLEELGPALQAQKLDTQAQQIYKDWEVLNAAWIRSEVITSRMAESVNAYVQQAVKMGAEVPEAMRPMLAKMVEMGQLTDASGNKIDSLESAGVSFSMTMSQGFQALITSVEKLADVLSRSLGVAVADTTKQIKAIPSKIPIQIDYTSTGAVPTGTGKGVPGFAGGTGGKFLDFGAGSLVMLHGREAVVPEGEAGPVGPAGAPAGGGGTVSITINAQGAFFDTPGDLQRLAEKVNDALTAKYGLTNRARAA